MVSEFQPDLTGIPETMLWTLYNRAEEAKRSDTYLRDPDCVRIYESISYDFPRNFGRPDDTHAMRSKIFDDAVREWLKKHPGGPVVELGSGLETEFQRCDNAKVQWVCVDVPEAIEIRRRFLPESPRCKYVAKNALDLSWMDEIKAGETIFISAQGLFMYFEEKDVRTLLRAIYARFPSADVVFDSIPPWFSKKTMEGFGKTRHYTVPKMPWGVNRSDIPAVVRSWIGKDVCIETTSYGFARGLKGKILMPLFSNLPRLRDIPPAITHISPAG